MTKWGFDYPTQLSKAIKHFNRSKVIQKNDKQLITTFQPFVRKLFAALVMLFVIKMF